MFVISQKAAEKFLESMEQIGETGLFLLVAARKHPDQGIAYNMGFDHATPEDKQFEMAGLKVCYDEETEPNIKDMVIDFGEHDGIEQFIFMNPQDAPANDPSSCGTTKGSGSCGSGKGTCTCG